MATSRDPDLRPANAGQFLRAIEEVKDASALPGTAPYQAPGYHASGPHGLPGYDRATEPHPPRRRTVRARLSPARSCCGRSDPGRPACVAALPGPRRPALTLAGPGPYGRDDEASQDTLLPDGGYEPGGYSAGRWDSGPQRPSGMHHRSSGEFRTALRAQHSGTWSVQGLRPVQGLWPHGDSGRWEAAGAVGASALPSLSPQNSHRLDAPPAGAALSAQPHAGRERRHPASSVRRPAAGRPVRSSTQAAGTTAAGRDRHASRGSAGTCSAAGWSTWLGGLAVILVIALASWWFSSGRYQKVPAVTGLTYSEASNVLQNLGLHAQAWYCQAQPDDEGRRLQGQPARGQKVPSGSTVTLLVSLGPVIRTVPNVSGQPEAAAKAYSAPAPPAGRPGQAEVSSSVPAGAVIGTIPRAYARSRRPSRCG